MTIEWTKTPEQLQKNIESWGDLVETSVGTAIADTAIEAQNYMRAARPWQDVSGNAKRGLRTDVEIDGEQKTLYFIHGVEYGVHLELARGGRYAIIIPTLQRTVPRLRAALQGIAD